MKNPYNRFPRIVTAATSNPIVIGLVVFAIPLLGLEIEYFGYRTAFGRSGAILVCVAIACVYLNHFISIDASNLETVTEAVRKIGSNETEIRAKLSTNIVGDSRNKVIATMLNTLALENETRPKLIKARASLVTTEFAAGICGTLVWGFGDLVRF